MDIFNKIWEELNRSPRQCAICKGTGKQKFGSFELQCQICEGTGINPVYGPPKAKPELSNQACSICDGTGKLKIGLSDMFCMSCSGTGEQANFTANEPQKKKPIPNFWGVDNTCPDCGGEGWVFTTPPNPTMFNPQQQKSKQTCGKCNGKGTL